MSDLMSRAYALADKIRNDEADGFYVDLGGRIAAFAADEIRAREGRWLTLSATTEAPSPAKRQ